MKNLVTGATGLVGSNLVEALLLRGESVRAYARPTSHVAPLRKRGVKVHVGHLTDQASVVAAAEGVDRIFHCAELARDWGPSIAFEQANVDGLRSVLGAATRIGARFIFLSTTDVYGFPGTAADEGVAPSPRGFGYADSKIEAEALVRARHRAVRLPTVIIRRGTVYGPGATRTVLGVVEALREHSLTLYDGGEHIAGLTYVGNLVDAMILAGDREEAAGRIYNVTDGSKVTWRQYVHALADGLQLARPSKSQPRWLAYLLATFWESYYRMTGKNDRPPMTTMTVEVMGTDQIYPIDRAKKELGYAPRVGTDEGVDHTIEWLRREGHAENALWTDAA
jgi:nucleoside-diphosphate-sugar epimerase